MLTYKISSRSSGNISNPSERKRVSPGDPDYKETVFKRVTSNLQWKVGDRARLQGGKNKGSITHINLDLNTVEWDSKHRPLFLTFKSNNSDATRLVGIHEITKKRSK